MKIEINVPVDLMSERNKIIRRNIIIKHFVDIEDIKTPQQIFNSKGNIVKNKCKVIIKDLGQIIIGHSYEYIKNIIEDKRIIIKGFLNEERNQSKRRNKRN